MLFLKFFHRFYLSFARIGWKSILVVFLVFFFGTWLSMAYFEGNAPIATKDVFWWYFMVTSTTVGYGDFSPATLGGRITGVVIMFMGISFIGLVIGKIGEKVVIHTQKRLKGQLQLYMKNHIVILGYQPEETEALVREILADTPEKGESIVLCSHSIKDNPLPGVIEFVHGNPSHNDTLIKACVSEAKSVIVYGIDDNESLAYGIAAHSRVNPEAHIVAFFRERENFENLRRVNSHIECISSVAVPMIVHAMQDPGTSKVVGNLLSHEDDGTSFRINVPEEFPPTAFMHLFCRFKEMYDATLIGVGNSHNNDVQIELNPPGSHIVTGGKSLFYIADKRLEEGVKWNKLVVSTK